MLTRSQLAISFLTLLASLALGSPAPAQSAAPGPGQACRESWLADVSSASAHDEYLFSSIEADLCVARNRAQELRIQVGVAGIEVSPRKSEPGALEPAWVLHLESVSLGRAGKASPLASASLSLSEERVELDHGPLCEWFINEPDGLEQGWTIATRPAGQGSLVIGLKIRGDLALQLNPDGRSGQFVDSSGQPRLLYGGLAAWDANGRDLAVTFELVAARLEIHLEDSGAAYPITVDPLLTNASWSAESNTPYSRFGEAVASAGDVNGDGFDDVIIGSDSKSNGENLEGGAIVYCGSATGLGLSPAWSVESNQAGAEFGFSVSGAGDVNGDGDGVDDVIVGARRYDGGELDEGRAYGHHGSTSGLSLTADWTAEANQASAGFATSVSNAGDVNGDGYDDVIVGAPLHDNVEFAEGRAFVYHGSPAGLGASPGWIAEPDQAGARFGVAVSTAGDVNGDALDDVIVGPPSTRTESPRRGVRSSSSAPRPSPSCRTARPGRPRVVARPSSPAPVSRAPRRPAASCSRLRRWRAPRTGSRPTRGAMAPASSASGPRFSAGACC